MWLFCVFFFAGKIGGREIGLYQLGFLGAGSNLDITADKDGTYTFLIVFYKNATFKVNVIL
jgi:hypothetical protein